MRLKSLSYTENLSKKETNPWELQELSLGERNLIVGKNATGKTRIVNVIHNFAKLIQKSQTVGHGKWAAVFVDGNHEIAVSVAIDNGKILHEQILIDGHKKLERTQSSAELYSEVAAAELKISPPSDRLVLHVRRDKKEFPFLEKLVAWAEGVRGFSFANTSPNLVEMPNNPSQLTSLHTVPSVLEHLSPAQLHVVLKQMSDMGYDIEAASTGWVEGLPPAAKMVFLKERGSAKPLKQSEISQGMFRAFSLLAIFQFLQCSSQVGCVLIDDLGEGLDFERSKKLADIIFGASDTKIQIIATSNESFLMNVVSLSDLILCYRSKHVVRCLNYANSREQFDAWRQLGLNNFDLFSSNFLLKS